MLEMWEREGRSRRGVVVRMVVPGRTRRVEMRARPLVGVVRTSTAASSGGGMLLCWSGGCRQLRGIRA